MSEVPVLRYETKEKQLSGTTDDQKFLGNYEGGNIEKKLNFHEFQMFKYLNRELFFLSWPLIYNTRAFSVTCAGARMCETILLKNF